MKTALIIHGHFYQPPRENPSIGIIEDQPSASPYKNWNEAIYQTCYRPNAHSRYLNNKGKILNISNNYERISVNFGPTLLNWIDDKHPKFAKDLIEADKKSIKKYGHSNFIAQCYNHTILPLDSLEIKKIEIAWALADYKKRFGHNSEGFWCSECAIDKETIDVLAQAGIKFVILSPWQATAINGVKLNGKPAPCDRPFIIEGNKEKISAFFYDPDLASGISFGHFLTDADNLYNHLVELKTKYNNPDLISCATDGEIYGHHEAFGDMALAALIKKVDAGNEFYLTNYASYLEENPATEVAQLFNGKSHSGSSWSCSHGVERWVSDCGCHTGGPDNWNQKWRGPLRTALKNLEIKARDIISRQLAFLLGPKADFNEIIISYGDVVVNKITASVFISQLEEKNGVKLSETDKSTIAILLESYKYILYSFTSCGWFFNDISGIEPKQNIAYAINAARNLQPYTKTYLRKQLMRDLDEAKSNITSEGTGANIAKKCYEEQPGAVSACFFFINKKFDRHIERFKYNYGFFTLRSISETTVVLENKSTLELFNFFYKVSFADNGNMTIDLRNMQNGYQYSKTIKAEEDSSISKNQILENITISFAKDIYTNGLNESQISLVINAIDGLRADGIEPDLTELQNVIYPYLTGKKKTIISQEYKKSLIEKLNFSYDLF